MDLDWQKIFDEESTKPYMKRLQNFLLEEKIHHQEIYPPYSQIFSAFEYCSFKDLKVVIVGQDPYHGEGQAHGLSFSVPLGIKPPPSLKNIFKEIHQDLQIPIPNHGNLISWAKQGVLLLNATLTVRKGEPKSHAEKGWEEWTDRIIDAIFNKTTPVVFLLWGKHAQEKLKKVERSHHLLLKAAHPSPFSAHSGFFGCKHFSKTNQFLLEHNQTPIDWSLPKDVL